jgi:Fungal Zn(2)-Cys(6) binuclear cluster domain
MANYNVFLKDNRACDHCRSHKTRCTRIVPCTNCQRRRIVCTKSSRTMSSRKTACNRCRTLKRKCTGTIPCAPCQASQITCTQAENQDWELLRMENKRRLEEFEQYWLPILQKVEQIFVPIVKDFTRINNLLNNN